MQKSKDVTIYDLASRLNISTATVSRALNNDPVVNKKTQKRIFDLAQELGYRHNRFASNLRKQKTYTIGVLVHQLNSNFITNVLSGIEGVLTEAGYDMIIAHSNEKYEKEKANAASLFQKRVDGLIASLAFDTVNLDHFKPFEEKQIPVVFFDRVEENSNTVKVIIDNYRSGYLATEHLIEQGCKRIAIVTANLKRNVYAQRYKGFLDAQFDHGLTFDEKYLVVRDLSEQSAIESARQIMKMNPMPDGLFVTNDFVAASCVHFLVKHGVRIPEDIAVVGFNNDVFSRMVEPQLTTVDYRGFDMGEIAARNLINHLKGISDIRQTSTIIVRSELITRESSLRKKS